jgi:hypothetical protein
MCPIGHLEYAVLRDATHLRINHTVNDVQLNSKNDYESKMLNEELLLNAAIIRDGNIIGRFTLSNIPIARNALRKGL